MKLGTARARRAMRRHLAALGALLLCAASLLAMPACASSHMGTDACADGAAGSPITRECFSQQYVEAACEVLGRAPIQYYGVAAILWSDRAACRASAAADEASYAADLAPDGPLVFDPVAAAACLDLLRRGHGPDDEQAIVCRGVYSAPDATVGNPCVRYRCAVGARCEVSPTCAVGRCVALGEPGAVCDGTLQCASSGEAIGFCWWEGGRAHCVQRVVEDLLLGGTCSSPPPDDGEVLRFCAPRHECVSGACAPRTAYPFGDDCVGGLCAPGRYCVYASQRCETPVVLARGAACISAIDTSAAAFCDIAAGLACDLVTHTCEPLGDGSPGARCGGGASVATNVCRAGLLCIDGRCSSARACSDAA